MIQSEPIHINGNTYNKALELIDQAIDEEEQYCIVFAPSKKRSLSQNALFHKWCGEIAEYFLSNGKTHLECGAPMNPETIKLKLKSRYLHTIVEKKWSYFQNKIVDHTVPAHTSKLNKSDMYGFMNNVHEFANTYRIPITIPIYSDYYDLRQANQ